MKWKGPSGKVQIKYYPGDLSRLWVLDPFSLHYFEVKAVDQEYTRGLSLWKHLVIKRFVRDVLKLKFNEDALLRAKERIQEIVEEEFRLTRKIRSRQGAARWLSIQVTTWMAATDSVSDTDDVEEELVQENEEKVVKHTLQVVDGPDHSADGESGNDSMPSREETTNSGEAFSSSVAVSDIGAPPPPLVPGITLRLEEETDEDENPIKPLPPMPEQPASRSRKNGTKQQGSRKGNTGVPVQPSPAETVSERPVSSGISVSYARSFTQ